MIIKSTQGPRKSSIHLDEEHRLLCELTRIDQRLKNKSDGKLHHEFLGIGEMTSEQECLDKNKRNCIKDNSSLPIYGTNMEYFSQICNQDIDDDSLFDPHNNFLATPKLFSQHQPNYNNEQIIFQPKRKDTSHSQNHSISHKHSKIPHQSQSQSQLLKERNYIYKKQLQASSQLVSKLPFPPKTSKITANKVMSSKSNEKRTTTSCTKDTLSIQNQLKGASSKQKYNLKDPIFQERQSQSQEDNEIKFKTFEAYLQKTLYHEILEKKGQKYAKCKKQQSDKLSLQCTFKPTILKKSSQMAKSAKNVVDRLSTSIHLKEQKKPYQPHSKQTLNKCRLQELSQPRKLKTQGPEVIEQTPSFRPSLSKKSLEQMSHCTYNVATRNQLWLEQRQEKIQKMRQEEEQQKRKRQNCTYSPSLCQYRGESDPRLSRFGRQGMVNYFERLSALNKGVRSKLDECMQGKENRQNCLNYSKQNFSTKGVKKPNYDQAVKKLHNRIMGLKI